jgi:phage repressor protein C with HTH and peptisase S24 domain
MVEDIDVRKRQSGTLIPVIGFAQAGTNGFFDELGYPEGDSWNEVQFPETGASNEDGIYALEISGDSMEPLYRKGDILVVSPKSKIRVGDRVIIKTTDGEVMAKELVKQNASRIEIKSLNPNHDNREIAANDLAWIARVVWVSQ